MHQWVESSTCSGWAQVLTELTLIVYFVFLCFGFPFLFDALKKAQRTEKFPFLSYSRFSPFRSLSIPSLSFPRKPDRHPLFGMAIQLKGPACIAVNQDSMYAVIEGSQLNSRDGGLFTLIKTEHPTIAAGNNIWSVVSTMPVKNFWDEEYDIFSQIMFSVCSVDRDGAFTFRLQDSSGIRYDPMAPKAPRLQTCSADSNSHGEWKQTYVISLTTDLPFRQLFIRPEIAGSGTSNSGGYNDGDEMVIYQKPVNVQSPPFLQYGRISKEAAFTKFTSDDLSPRISLVSIR